MAYHLKQDPECLMKARTILSSELGDEAWDLPDEDIVRFAEATLNSFVGTVAPLRPKLRRIAEEMGKTRRGRWLGKALDIYPPLPVSVEERLHEVAEAA